MTGCFVLNKPTEKLRSYFIILFFFKTFLSLKMPSKTGLYDILGVSKNATDAEIKVVSGTWSDS